MSDISVNDCISYTMISLGLIVIIFLLVSLSCSKNNEYFSRQDTRGKLEKKINDGINSVTHNKTTKNLISDKDISEKRLSPEEMKDAINMGNKFIADSQSAEHRGHERDNEVVPYQDGPDSKFQIQNEMREKQLIKSRLHSVARLGVGQIGPSYSQLLSKIYIPKVSFLTRYDDQNPHTVVGQSYDSFVYSDSVPSDYNGSTSSLVSLSLRNENGTTTAFGYLIKSISKIKNSTDHKKALEDSYNEIIKDNPMISSKHVEVFIHRLVKKKIVDNDLIVHFTMEMIKKDILSVISIFRLLQLVIHSNIVSNSDIQEFILSILNELSVDDKILLLSFIVEHKNFEKIISLKYSIQYVMKQQIPFEKSVNIVSGYISKNNNVKSIINTIKLLKEIKFFNNKSKNIATLLNKIYASNKTIIKVVSTFTTSIYDFAELIYNMDFTDQQIIDIAVEVCVSKNLRNNDIASFIIVLHKFKVYPDLMQGASQFLELLELSESDKNIVMRTITQKIETFGLDDMGMVSIPGLSKMNYEESKNVITDVSKDPLIIDINNLEKEIERELSKV